MKRTYLILLACLVLITLAFAQKEFGSKESAKWTATTNESATNDAQKQWLARGKPETITGEVVDVSCYM
jgi:hypothetical protein